MGELQTTKKRKRTKNHSVQIRTREYSSSQISLTKPVSYRNLAYKNAAKTCTIQSKLSMCSKWYNESMHYLLINEKNTLTIFVYEITSFNWFTRTTSGKYQFYKKRKKKLNIWKVRKPTFFFWKRTRGEIIWY